MEPELMTIRSKTDQLPKVLLLASAALLPLASYASDSNFGTPLFAQTHTDNSSFSEGYANPEAMLNNSLTSNGVDIEAGNASTNNRSGNNRPLQSNNEIYVSDVSTVLFNDADQDGYYAGFSVTLDVDVSWDSADVFANIFLQSNGSSPEFLHSTNVFTVFGQESFDRYRVDVDLTDNFFADEYDIIIDVVDAYSTLVVDTVSHRTHNNLSRLPLESNSNQIVRPFFDDGYNGGFSGSSNIVTTFTVDVSSGSSFYGSNQGFSGVGFGVSARVTEFRGGAGWLILLALAGVGVFRTLIPTQAFRRRR